MTAARLTVLLALLPLMGAASPSFAQQAPTEGERLFRTRCASCHSVQPGQNRIGPHLAGVVGRTAASVQDARYSEGLRASGLVWDEQTLDTYLTDPRQTVPGTTMAVTLQDVGQRRAIIDYLRSLSTGN